MGVRKVPSFFPRRAFTFFCDQWGLLMNGCRGESLQQLLIHGGCLLWGGLLINGGVESVGIRYGYSIRAQPVVRHPATRHPPGGWWVEGLPWGRRCSPRTPGSSSPPSPPSAAPGVPPHPGSSTRYPPRRLSGGSGPGVRGRPRRLSGPLSTEVLG